VHEANLTDREERWGRAGKRQEWHR